MAHSSIVATMPSRYGGSHGSTIRVTTIGADAGPGREGTGPAIRYLATLLAVAAGLGAFALVRTAPVTPSANPYDGFGGSAPALGAVTRTIPLPDRERLEPTTFRLRRIHCAAAHGLDRSSTCTTAVL